MNRDFEDLLASLTTHEVEFLIVGSLVLAYYGRPRYTEDMDLWVRKSRENIVRLAAALEEFGAPVNRDALMALADKNDQMMILGAKPQAVDILNHIAGLEFDEAWQNRQFGTFFGSKISVLSKEDFLKAKRAAGRPKDLSDIAMLEEIEGD